MEEADAGCHGYCMLEACEAALVDHLVACLSPVQFPFNYTLTTSCTAINNQVRNPDGTFGFFEQPLNDPMNDPKICGMPENLEHEPPRGLGQYKASASDGTMARLSVVGVEEAPVLERGEHFRFAEGTLRVLMQAYVDGVPLVLSATNVGSPSGRLSPAGDQFSISGLRFTYADSVVKAALEIDIQGQYDARRPTAQITRVAAPARCDEPVSLLATSWDADQDPLTHTWWVRGIGSFTGPLLELPLPAGEHTVMLTSSDASKLLDSETLRYTRVCR